MNLEMKLRKKMTFKKYIILCLILSFITVLNTCRNDQKSTDNKENESIEVQIPKKPTELKIILDIGEKEWKTFHNEILYEFERYHNCKIYPYQFDTVDLIRKLTGMIQTENPQIDLYILDYTKAKQYIKRGLVSVIEAYREIVPEKAYQSLIELCEYQDFEYIMELVDDIPNQLIGENTKVNDENLAELKDACLDMNYSLAKTKLDNFKNIIKTLHYKLIEETLTNKVLYFFPYSFDVKINIFTENLVQRANIPLPNSFKELIGYINFNVENHPPKRSFLFSQNKTQITGILMEAIVSAKNTNFDDPKNNQEIFAFLKKIHEELIIDKKEYYELLSENRAILIRDWASENLPKDKETADNLIYGNLDDGNLVRGKVLAITKKTKNQELAIKFIEYLYSESVQAKLVDEFGFSGIREDAYDSVEMYKLPYYEAVKKGLMNPLPINILSEEAKTNLYKNYMEYLQNENTDAN